MGFLKHLLFLCTGLLLILMIVTACGQTTPSATKPPATPSVTKGVPSKTLYVETSQGVSAVRAIDGVVLHTYPQAYIFVVANNSIYLATDQEIAAFNVSNNQKIWSIPNTLTASSIVATQDTVFVSLGNYGSNLLYALDSHTGIFLWRKTFDTLGSSNLAVLVSNNVPYVWYTSGLEEVTLAELNPQTGDQQWASTFNSINDILVVKDTLVVMGENNFDYMDQFICGLNASNGALEWSIDPVGGSLANGSNSAAIELSLVTNGTLYLSLSLPSEQYMLTAYDLNTGKQEWAVPTNEEAYLIGDDYGALTGDGFFAIGGPSDGDLTARSIQNGQKFWTVPSTNTFQSISEDHGIIYTIDEQSGVEAYSTADGKHLWTYPPQDNSTLHKMTLTFLDHTPYLVRQDDTQDDTLTSIDPATGQPSWQTQFEGISGVYYFN